MNILETPGVASLNAETQRQIESDRAGLRRFILLLLLLATEWVAILSYIQSL